MSVRILTCLSEGHFAWFRNSQQRPNVDLMTFHCMSTVQTNKKLESNHKWTRSSSHLLGNSFGCRDYFFWICQNECGWLMCMCMVYFGRKLNVTLSTHVTVCVCGVRHHYFGKWALNMVELRTWTVKSIFKPINSNICTHFKLSF